jgi:trk system potassium uptake protein
MLSKFKNISIKLNTTQMIVYSFIVFLFIGTTMLTLPIASNDNTSAGVINALFTATSALCVVGLSVVSTYSQL